MLIAARDLLFDDPFAFLVLFIAVAASLLIALTFHEFAHAWTAYRLGDLTAQRAGRLTLNPRAHLDPVGTVMVLVLGFGWGKPVPVNPAALRNGRRGMALVSVAGPASNVLVALAFATLFQLGLVSLDDLGRNALQGADPLAWAALIASFGVTLNLILAAFNLLPLFPLDGSGILTGIVPRQWLPAIVRLQRVAPLLLILVIVSSIVTGRSALGFLFGPVIRFADSLMGL